MKAVRIMFWVPIWVPKKEKPTIDVGFGGVFVPGAGIEPARDCSHWFLRPTRLPIPPSGRRGCGFGCGCEWAAKIFKFSFQFQLKPLKREKQKAKSE